ncbi:MAG: SRPBCC family protein [Actinomycetota bacterium]
MAGIVAMRGIEVKERDMRVMARVVIGVDPATLWARLLEWEAQPTWMVDAVAVRVVGEQRAGVGTTIAVKTKLFGVPALTDTLVVTAWDPPHRLEMERTGFVRGRGEWRVEPHADGGRFGWIEHVSMPIPVLGELALLLYRPLMRRLMRRSLANLARMLR